MDLSFGWQGVALGTVAYMLIGFVWYMKGVFGKIWMKSLGWTEKDIKKGDQGKSMVLMLLASLVTVFVLHVVITVFTEGMYGVVPGIQGGFWCWLGFMLTSNGTNAVFERRVNAGFWVNISFQLVAMLAAGAIIGYMGEMMYF